MATAKGCPVSGLRLQQLAVYVQNANVFRHLGQSWVELEFVSANELQILCSIGSVQSETFTESPRHLSWKTVLYCIVGIGSSV